MAEENKENEVVIRLARVGYDNAPGYLKGGFKAWVDAGLPADAVEQVSVDNFASLNASSSTNSKNTFTSDKEI